MTGFETSSGLANKYSFVPPEHQVTVVRQATKTSGPKIVLNIVNNCLSVQNIGYRSSGLAGQYCLLGSPEMTENHKIWAAGGPLPWASATES